MKRVATVITFAIAFYLGTVFSHLNAWFMRATETVSPSPGEKAGVDFKPKFNCLSKFSNKQIWPCGDISMPRKGFPPARVGDGAEMNCDG
jgi:hypothetical protein